MGTSPPYPSRGLGRYFRVEVRKAREDTPAQGGLTTSIPSMFPEKPPVFCAFFFGPNFCPCFSMLTRVRNNNIKVLPADPIQWYGVFFPAASRGFTEAWVRSCPCVPAKDRPGIALSLPCAIIEWSFQNKISLSHTKSLSSRCLRRLLTFDPLIFLGSPLTQAFWESFVTQSFIDCRLLGLSTHRPPALSDEADPQTVASCFRVPNSFLVPCQSHPNSLLRVQGFPESRGTPRHPPQ